MGIQLLGLPTYIKQNNPTVDKKVNDNHTTILLQTRWENLGSSLPRLCQGYLTKILVIFVQHIIEKQRSKWFSLHA